jgi:hypothetical protein
MIKKSITTPNAAIAVLKLHEIWINVNICQSGWREGAPARRY